jgi:cation diffusion facilitator CzcD-associated flavoprotein CzcO/acetyl esterase/lipase
MSVESAAWQRERAVPHANEQADLDVVVVGAGFAGLYLLHRLRSLGFRVKVLESADDVGGTWYWNRYPGARCDIESIDYSYSFDRELEAEWRWSERYATQPEILRYLGHVADKHDLRRDIRFGAHVAVAAWNEDTSTWSIRTHHGDELHCRFYVMASGCLSLPKTPDVEGYGRFRGESYYTGRWPQQGVDFKGKRVAVIGTGSSGVQSIPIIAQQSAELTVFQRTPNFSRPAFNGAVSAERKAVFDANPAAYREAARFSLAGVPMPANQVGVFQVSENERLAKYEAAYASGHLLSLSFAFADIGVNPAANQTVCDFLCSKIRSIVRDPKTAEALCPTDHFYGTKRPCIDSNYFETFNLPHVRLVDLRREPFVAVTERGIDTTLRSFEFDVIVFATGFDAMTGAIVAVDIAGRDGLTLKGKWADGPITYLGLTTVGFPNLFLITGPGSPSVLSNMVVSIEQHVDWVSDCIAYLRGQGLEAIEATPMAEAAWVQHVNDCADITLAPRANSWYMGANVPGKPRVFLPYIGGVDRYRKACDEVAARDYLGFLLKGPNGTRCNDGVIRRLQPDIATFLETIAGLALPPMEALSVADARSMVAAMNTQRPPGPNVGEIVDGVLQGAAGDLPYRLYRPATPGPHPIVAYFHGGGWVFGGADSDDPFCRDLCVRSGAVIVSVEYRHAPEHPFPAAALDAFAAVQWIAASSRSLGGQPGRLAVCGWSAGGNVAAIACQLARDADGPHICGQVLVNPVTDWDLSGGSAVENAEGYVLTTALMKWFWDHYASPADRQDPRASPLRAKNLANLPPALVVTCEFDPLRDQGAAYAQELAAAGVSSRHLPCRGHIHTSLTAVDLILSGAGARKEMGESLRRFLRSDPRPHQE